ncbi:MAG: hypothetical protein U9Q83_00225, partial [Bacteroidota bacterium]|nr:hypothetical protein [Bacteroidota bacterium]
KMKFKVPIIEPLMITGCNGEWIHPHIEILTLDLLENEQGDIFGPLIKLDFEFKSGKQFRIIALTTENGMIDMMDDDELENYAEMILVTLGEDVWTPGNMKPFVFTKYGEAFNEEYNCMFSEPYKIHVSPDISLNHDDVDWWWSS